MKHQNLKINLISSVNKSKSLNYFILYGPTIDTDKPLACLKLDDPVNEISSGLQFLCLKFDTKNQEEKKNMVIGDISEYSVCIALFM